VKRLVLLVAAAAVVLAGCTSEQGAEPTPTERTVTSTVTGTRTPPGADYTPAPATTVKPLNSGAEPRKGEKEALCPYLRTGLNQDPTNKPNVADIEGDRIYRTTILTDLAPVGCRFYFAYSAHEAVADIQPRTFATATAAYTAMIRTSEAGTEQITEKNFSGTLTGICYRTKFFGPDGARDWAFVFAKGKVMVVVHTQRTDSSRNALYLAQAIAARF
jgi:hypothetical protein